MILKFKHYEIKVAEYVEDDFGNITKEIKTITIEGTRITEAAIRRAIPEGCRLISHGYVEEKWDVDTKGVYAFATSYGKRVEE